MSYSVRDRLALLPKPERDEYLASLDEEVILDIANGAWWTLARPEQLPPEGDWSGWYLRAGRGGGKALALDTLIPTPIGWSTMGELVDGDEVFGDDGRVCRVVKAHDVLVGRDCFEVEFSDGSKVTCDADHLWLTSDVRTRKAHNRTAVPTLHPQVRTTREISETMTFGPRGDRNHSVHVAAPLKTVEVELPVDPYVLGYWLGDGSSATAEVTISDEDAEEILAELAQGGAPVSGPPRRRHDDAGCQTYPIGGRAYQRDLFTGRMLSNGSLHSLLRQLGVLKNKHVPAEYLRASVDQRVALLAGLLDSDGSVNSRGHKVEFCSTKKELADAVFELAVSLGHKVTSKESDAKINGRVVGRRWRVIFRPLRSDLFRLRRKAERIKPVGAQASRQGHRMIVAVTPVPSVPVRCITVDSPSRLYLCTRSMIPTHNTRTGSEWTRENYERISPQVDGYRQALVGPTMADVRDTMVEGESGLANVLPPSMLRNGSWDDSWNRSLIEVHLEDGGILKGFSSEKPARLRGPQFHGAWVDEPGYLADAHLGTMDDTTWSNLMLGLRLPPDPRVVITGTPKNNKLIKELIDDESIVVTQFSTYENLHNLASQFAKNILSRYEGSRLGRQELHADLLDSIGTMFQRGWFTFVDEPPPNASTTIRYWDLAATEPHDANPDPDWTAGARLSIVKGANIYCIEHVMRFRKSPGQRDNVIRNRAIEDGKKVVVWVEQEKAQAGKSTVSALSRHLDGVARVKGHPVSGTPKGKFTLGIEGKASEAKIMRAEIMASAAEDRRVLVVNGKWNDTFMDEVEEFPNGAHFDQVDAVAGGFQVLTSRLAGRGRGEVHDEALVT